MYIKYAGQKGCKQIGNRQAERQYTIQLVGSVNRQVKLTGSVKHQANHAAEHMLQGKLCVD